MAERKQKTNRNKNLEKIASIASILLLILAWYLGGLRTNNSQAQFFQHISTAGSELVEVSPNLYQLVALMATKHKLNGSALALA
ncbi:hypothetical protein JCM19238_4856 [Vibrio ponticus]|nr:hypothetical protein JCM19238_4856 [Vibrio ponticus]